MHRLSERYKLLCMAGQIRKLRQRKVNLQAHQLEQLERGVGISSNPGHLRAKPKSSWGHKAASASPSCGAFGAEGKQEVERTGKKEKHLRL